MTPLSFDASNCRELFPIVLILHPSRNLIRRRNSNRSSCPLSIFKLLTRADSTLLSQFENGHISRGKVFDRVRAFLLPKTLKNPDLIANHRWHENEPDVFLCNADRLSTFMSIDHRATLCCQRLWKRLFPILCPAVQKICILVQYSRWRLRGLLAIRVFSSLQSPAFVLEIWYCTMPPPPPLVKPADVKLSRI